MSNTEEASSKRAKKATVMQNSRKEQTQTQAQELSSLRILVVLPEKAGDFKIPFPGSDDFYLGKSFRRYTSQRGYTEDWIYSYFPTLFENVPPPLFSWTRVPDKPDDIECILQSCTAAWAFSVACLLGGKLITKQTELDQLSQEVLYQQPPSANQQPLVDRKRLAFTTASSFKKAATSSSNAAQLIGENFNLIFLCCPFKFRDCDESGEVDNPFHWKEIDKVLSFCSYDLMVKNGVKIYPPMSVSSWVIQKTKRNQDLRDLRLPSVTIELQTTWSETLNIISSQFNDNGQTCDAKSGFVVKPEVGSEGLGVFRLWKENEEVLAVTLIDSKSLTIGDKIEAGMKVSVEPFVEELKSEELRVFYTPRTLGLKLAELFTCRTRLNDDGEIVSEVNYWCHFHGRNISRKRKLDELKKNIWAAMSERFTAKVLMHLCFRFDVFFMTNDEGEKQAVVNEVEVFPAAEPFLTQGEMEIGYLLLLAKSTYCYIRDHIDCWPC